GNWENRTFHMVAGGSTDKTSVTLTAEWKRSDPLIQFERPFSRGLYRTPTYAGIVSIGTDFYYMNPALNAPPAGLDGSPADLVAAGVYTGPMGQEAASQFLDLANYPTLLADAERRSMTAAIEHKLSQRVTLFSDLIYTINNTETVLNAQ